jgi:hypothetical protein
VQCKSSRFLSINDLVEDQGELALSIDYDLANHTASVEACAILPDNTTQEEIAAAYVSLCDSNSACFDSLFLTDLSQSCSMPTTSGSDSSLDHMPYISFSNVKPPLTIFAGKKYKPVVLKVRPVETELPSQFCIICNIKGDPLENIPELPMHPQDFKPMGCYTQEQKEQFNKVHAGDFLLPEEKKLCRPVYVPTKQGIHLEQPRVRTLLQRLLSANRNTDHSAQALCTAKHTDTAQHLHRSLLYHQAQDQHRCL